MCSVVHFVMKESLFVSFYTRNVFFSCTLSFLFLVLASLFVAPAHASLGQPSNAATVQVTYAAGNGSDRTDPIERFDMKERRRTE